MSYAESHVLLVAHGTLPSGELWSCGMRSTGDGGHIWLQDELNNIGLATANAWRAFQNTSGIGWAAGVSLDGVTARALGSDGKTYALAERSPATAAGGGTTLVLPTQCAVVVTLISGRPGRTGKGRVYLPLLSLALNATTARIGPTTATTISGAMATLIRSINTALIGIVPAGGDVVGSRLGIQSQVENTPNQARAVLTAVRVGDVVDTQRRRRDKIAENYSNTVI